MLSELDVDQSLSYLSSSSGGCEFDGVVAVMICLRDEEGNSANADGTPWPEGVVLGKFWT